MSVLIISEKNKAAQAIAQSLGKTKKIRHSKSVSVYNVTAKNIYVVPLRGHIKQYKNTKPYQKWTSKDPKKIITDPKAIYKMNSRYAGSYISALKKYGKRANLCVIGTDADTEGCNIGLIDGLDFVKKVNPKISVKQMWLNDLQTQSIRKAYSKLISPKWSWAYSAEARAIIDAVIGFSATREVTLTLQPILKDINVKFTSIGRVQTSLLYLIYKREQLIRDFNPQPFWKIMASLNLSGENLKASHVDNNFNNKSVADAIYQKIKNSKQAKIKKAQAKMSKKYPPNPLNTSNALQLITKNLKINAKLAMKTLENLYLNKAISYPRTDSDRYSDDYNHKKILSTLEGDKKFKKYIQDRYKKNKTYPKQGKKNAGDHSPITPLVNPSGGKKIGGSLDKKVYNLICRHYLALFGDPALEATVKLLIDIDNEQFILQIKNLLKEGFLKIAPFLKRKYNQAIPFIVKNLKNIQNINGKIIKVNEILKEEKETRPPPRYSDTSLLRLMEQKNLGTKSTRPAIIEVLIQRKYIQRRGRTFFVTQLGYLLIESLIEIWKSFLEPSFTAYVEKNLEMIKKGKKNMEDVVKEVKKKFLALFEDFRKNKSKILKNMKQIQKTGNFIQTKNKKTQLRGGKNAKGGNQSYKDSTTANCPKCKLAKMVLIKAKNKKKNFLKCTRKACGYYLSLPKKGYIKLLKSKCKICGFNVVKITRSNKGNRYKYYICPQCWNQSFKDKNKDIGFCSNCKDYTIKRGRCVKKNPN